MPLRREDQRSSLQEPWTQPQTYATATLMLELNPLELMGPAVDELDLSMEDSERQDEILKEWVWKTHREEIWKHLRVRGHKAQKVQPQNPSPRTESELYKKRWELTLRVARASQNFLQDEGSKVVYQCLLNGLLELEDSQYGFLGEVRYANETQEPYIQVHATTSYDLEHASLPAREFFKENRGRNFTNMASLLGQVLATAKPVVANSVTQDCLWELPDMEALPRIDNFLGLPIYGRERNVIGILCLANKRGGYSHLDVSSLELFTATASNLIQSHCQLEENRRLIHSFEERVKERTLCLQQTVQHLEQQNQLVMQTSNQQLQQFACMSHELRTPLNCIIGLSSLLEGTEMTPHQRDNMKLITTSGNLLLNVVNDVLDFSKLATGNLEIDMKKSSLQDALDATVHAVDMKARTRYLTLKTVYDPQLPEYIETDTHRLQQILFNLLGNAIKFSKEGGEIELAVSIFSEVDERNKTTSENDFSRRRDEKVKVLRSSTSDISRPPDDSAAAGMRMRKRLGCLESMSQGPEAPNMEISNKECQDRPDTSIEISTKRKERRRRTKHLPLAREKSINRTQSNPEQFELLEQECMERLPLRSTTPRRQHFVRFVVKDYGKGIEENALQTIFEPFRQESACIARDHGGTGLGLSITAKLVEALGGRISADSRIGEWTEFIVDIPLKGAFANKPFSLGRKLGPSTVVNVIGRNFSEEQTLKVCLENCGIRCETRLSSDMIDEPILSDADCLVCLIHEDKFGAEAYRLFVQAKPRTTLISYGHAHSIQDSVVHIRSPMALLPCVLIGTIQSALETSSGNPPERMVLRRSSMIFPHRFSSSRKDNDITKLRVLVAEDNLINQKVIARMLQRLGIKEFVVVDNGQKAVDTVAGNSYDIVFMDMHMPVMDGIQACEFIVQQQQSKAKVVFVSANVSRNNEIMKAGAWDCIPKPFKLENIRDCLQRVAKLESL